MHGSRRGDEEGSLRQRRPLAWATRGRGEEGEGAVPRPEARLTSRPSIAEGLERDTNRALGDAERQLAAHSGSGRALGSGHEVFATYGERGAVAGEEDTPALEPRRAAIPADLLAVSEDRDLDEAEVGLVRVLQQSNVAVIGEGLGETVTVREREGKAEQDDLGRHERQEDGRTQGRDRERRDEKKEDENGERDVSAQIGQVPARRAWDRTLGGVPPSGGGLSVRSGAFGHVPVEREGRAIHPGVRGEVIVERSFWKGIVGHSAIVAAEIVSGRARPEDAGGRRGGVRRSAVPARRGCTPRSRSRRRRPPFPRQRAAGV